MVKKILFISLALFGLLFSTMPPACFADAAAQLQQAETYKQNEQYEQAEAIYRGIVTDYPGTDEAFQAQKSLALLYIKTARYPAARQEVDVLLTNFAYHPELPGEVYKLAEQYWRKKRYEDAKSLYEYIAENHSDSDLAIKARRSVVVADILLGNDAAAQAGVDALIRDFAEDPELAGMLWKLGNISCEGGKYDRSAELYQYVIDNWPKTEHEMRAKTGIAKLNISLGNDAAVEATIDSLIADFNDHPTLSHALFSIAEKYFYKGNYRQAIDLWQLVRTDYPDCPLNHEIPYLLATCYERLEEYPTAIEYYIEVVEQYPDSRYAYRAPYRLGVLYRRQKHYDKALYWFQKQRELYSDKLHGERALHCQGAIYLCNLEDYQAAAEICQKLLEEYPERQYTTITKYNLAVCYDILAPSAETRKMLQEARDKLYSDVITIKPIEKPSKSQEGG